MDPALELRAGDELLVRTKAVAHLIKDRVRHALDPAGSSRGSIRVLCVDDNADAADSLAFVLEILGCEARACYGGLAAIEVFSEFHPEVCFLDLCMPGMDGMELAGCLRTLAGSRALLLVAVTALGSLEDRTNTAVTGFHFHLLKPVPGAALAEVLNQWREITGPP